MRRKTIAIDMDQVITDTLAKQMAVYNEYFQTNYTKEDAVGIGPEALYPEYSLEFLIELVDRKGFFRDLEFLSPDVFPVMQRLHEVYDIYICTAAMAVPQSLEDKFLWLQEHLPFIPKERYVFCGDKSIVCTDIMVDDSVKQVSAFRGRRILFDAPWNHLEEGDFERVFSWKELAELLL